MRPVCCGDTNGASTTGGRGGNWKRGMGIWNIKDLKSVRIILVLKVIGKAGVQEPALWLPDLFSLLPFWFCKCCFYILVFLSQKNVFSWITYLERWILITISRQETLKTTPLLSFHRVKWCNPMKQKSSHAMVFHCFSSAVMFMTSALEIVSLLPLRFKKIKLALCISSNRAR